MADPMQTDDDSEQAAEPLDQNLPAAVTQQPITPAPSLKLSELIAGRKKLSSLMSERQSETKTREDSEPFLSQIGKGFLGEMAAKETTIPERLYYKQFRPDIMTVGKAYGMGTWDAFHDMAPLSDSTEKFLKDAGAFTDYTDAANTSHNTIMDLYGVRLARSMASSMKFYGVKYGARPLMTAASTGFAGLAAPFMGALPAAEQLEKEMTSDTGGNINFSGAITEPMEWALTDLTAVHGVLPPHVAEAKANRTIETNNGEAIYFGLKEPDKEQQKEITAAARMYPEAHEDYFPDTPKERTPDIGTLEGHARGIDKEAFELRDRLTQKVERLSQWYAEAKEKQTSPFSEDLAKAREKLETGSPKNRKVYAARVAELEEKHAAHGVSGDAEKIWKELQSARGELYDLAGTGRIAKAYREADAKLPKVAEQRVEFEEPEMPITPEAETLIAAEPPAVMTPEIKAIAKKNKIAVTEDTTPAQVVEALRARQEPTAPAPPRVGDREAIVEQETAKLLKAGRTAEQAADEARIAAARYEARAAAFEGKRGTALELYRSEAPDLRAGQQRAVKAAKKIQPKLKFQNERTPILSWMARKGGVNSKSQIAQDLRGMGLGYGKKYTPVGLFRESGIEGKKGAGEFDNFPADEYYHEFGVHPPVTKDGYVEPNWLQEQISKEIAGQKVEEGAAAYDDLDITNQIQKEVVDAAKEMAVHDLSKSDIAAIADMMRKDISLEAQDAITDFVEREAIKEFNQSANAKIRLSDGEKKALITVFNGGDASSIIHEYSHQWLDELLKDAEHADAPEQLKKDSEQARKYTGIKKDTEGKEYRKAHEKWARSVERYFLEGVAPSKELAGVFERLKRSMTAVYESIKNFISQNKNAAKLDDATRAVFDRLLAHNGERTVVAPEFEHGELAANIHESDAMTTLPEHYAQVADTIFEEQTAAIKKGLEEYANAVIPTEAGTGDATVPQPQPANGAEGGTTSTGEAPQAVIEGGNQPERESHTRGVERPTVAKPRFTDAAGNIRIDLLESVSDAHEALREVADENDDFMTVRGGVVTDAERLSLAQSMGVDPKEIDIENLRGAATKDGVSLSVRIQAGRKWLDQASVAATEAGKKARSERTPESIQEFADARLKLLMIAEAVSGITSEWGRAGRAFHAMSPDAAKMAYQNVELFQNMTGTTPQKMLELADNMANISEPEKGSRLVRDSTKKGFWDKIKEYRKASMLSNPVTWVKNTVDNATMVFTDMAEASIASGIGKVLRSDDRVQLNEVKAKWMGAKTGSVDGWSILKDILKDENSIPDSARLTHQLRNEARKTAELSGRTGQELENRIDELVKNPTPEMVINARSNLSGRYSTERPHTKAIEGRAGEIIRVPFRVMEGTDEAFKSIAYQQEINVQAARAANKEGLEGDAWNTRVAKLKQYPTEEMMDAALDFADKQTLTQDLGEVGKRVQSILNHDSVAGRIAGELIPFYRTPVNSVKYWMADRTIFGAITPEFWRDVTGKNGDRARDYRLARVGLGTSWMAAASYLVLSGGITGGGPSDAKQRDHLKSIGWQPYSLKIGDGYYSYQGLMGLGSILGVSADVMEAIHFGNADGKTTDRIFAAAVAAISTRFMQMSSLTGLSDAVNAVHNPLTFGEKWLQSYMTSYIPSVSGNIAKVIDPSVKQVNTVWDAALNKVPFAKGTLKTKYDVWGQDIVSEGALGPDLISPIYQSTAKNDPVTAQLVSLRYFPARPSEKIRGVKLTQEQYDLYARTSGIQTKLLLNRLVASPSFNKMPREAKIDSLKSAVNMGRIQAQAVVNMKYPEIAKKASENQRSLAR